MNKQRASYPGRRLVSGGIVALAALSARADVITNLACVADTTLQQDFPDNNLGGADSFTAGGRNQGGPTRALLQFDIAGAMPAGATIHSATLTVTVIAVNGPDSTFAVHRLLAAWGEGTGADFRGGSPGGDGEATWNVRLGPGTPWATAGGDFAPTASATQTIGGTGSFSFTSAALAADVQAWLDQPGTNFGWLLRSQSETTPGTIRRFAGRLDATVPPQLVVDYSIAVAPAAQPVITDLAVNENQVRFSFDGESNRTYTVEFRDSLAAGVWDALTNIPAQPAASTFHITNTISSAERYFRVRTP
jgi:hypothetical protein